MFVPPPFRFCQLLHVVPGMYDAGGAEVAERVVDSVRVLASWCLGVCFFQRFAFSL